jgi:hypothetical protein
MLQYFSITVIPSPTSKEASWVAGLPQIVQYFIFFCLGLLTKGFSVNKNLLIEIHFVMVPTSATIGDKVTIAAAAIKNLVL